MYDDGVLRHWLIIMKAVVFTVVYISVAFSPSYVGVRCRPCYHQSRIWRGERVRRHRCVLYRICRRRTQLTCQRLFLSWDAVFAFLPMHFVAHSSLVAKRFMSTTAALVSAFSFDQRNAQAFSKSCNWVFWLFVRLRMPVIDDREHVMRLSCI